MIILQALLIAVGLYLAVVGTAYLAQTWLIFPTRLATSLRPDIPSAAERLGVTTADGERLAGIRIPASEPEGERGPLLLGFAGNAWNADAMAITLHALFPHRDVAAFHYRGYSPSTGRPSTEAILGDALRIFDEMENASPKQGVVAVGFSIGSGPAAYLARQRPVMGTILVTPFDSLVELAREHYSWAPVRLLLRHRMPTIEFIRETQSPIALIAAGRDAIVPARRSDPLRRTAPNLVFDRTIAEAGHNDLYDRQDFAVAMREALARIEAASVRR